MYTSLIHTPQLSQSRQRELLSKIPGELTTHGGHLRLQHEQAVEYDVLAGLRADWQVDINTLPEGFDASRVRLVISDMDSTFINIECIDEIADFAGKKAEVSSVTEAAMRGELNFEQSLNQRVALLAGVHTDALQQVYEQRLQLNPGAETLVAGLHAQGIRFALVSGGFTFFTERLKQRYQLDYTRANTLEIMDGLLTGKVEGEIVGAGVKRDYLLQLCQELHIEPSQVIAMGDGANDLLMMEVAGIGVAYRAKPKVEAQADCVIAHGGLDSVLDLLA